MPSAVLRSALPALLCLPLFAAGCGSVKLWPFGGGVTERPRTPADATEFNCAAGKRFHVRYLEGGKSAWVMLPEREFRLDQVAAGEGARYSNGPATLVVVGASATLNDGPLTAFTECRSGPTEAAKGG